MFKGEVYGLIFGLKIAFIREKRLVVKMIYSQNGLSWK